MSDKHNSGLRAGNRALSYLVSHYSPMNAKLEAFTDSLPKFADQLYRDAQDAARTLLRTHTQNVIIAALPGTNAKETALAKSIFDLQLTVFLAS